MASGHETIALLVEPELEDRIVEIHTHICKYLEVEELFHVDMISHVKVELVPLQSQYNV